MKKNQHLHKSLINLVKLLIVSALFFAGSTTNSVFAQNWSQIIKTVASDRGVDDEFGWSVDISGDYAIVGAWQEDEDATGENIINDAGSAYIFKNIAGTWSQVQKIVASDRAANDKFGYSVAISGDYAIVGAYSEDHDATGENTMTNAGSAYIFKNIAGTWSQVQKIVASDRAAEDWFGLSVAISGDYAIVGTWREDEDATGGNTLSSAGSAYIFKNNAGTWSQEQKIVASDRAASDNFGCSVAISGDYAIVGARYEDEDATGENTLDFAGSAYIFKNTAGTWSQLQKIVSTDRGAIDYFGWSVAISGDYAIVGAYYEDEDAVGGNTLVRSGSAYIFKNNAGTWSQVQKIVASDRETNDEFGWSVDISGDYAIVGAPFEDNDDAGGNPLFNAGSAYIFKNNAGTWSQIQKTVASDRWVSDEFGYSVSISGDYAITGARYEDEDATGGNTLYYAGSAYLFKNCETSVIDVQTACDSFTWIDGTTYTESNNSATYILTNLAGCDSIVTLNLNITQPTFGIDTQSSCESFTWIDGNTYTESNNSATYILTNLAGCDSIVTLNLNIAQPTSGIDTQSSCESFTWIDGNTYTESNNSASYVLTNIAGCDSIVTLNLNITQPTSGIDTQSSCESFTWIDGNTYTESNNSATYVLTNIAGCDSIVTLNLTLNAIDISTTTSGPVITSNQAGAMYQWIDCDNGNEPIDGETGQSFTATATGNYAVMVTLANCTETSDCQTIDVVGLHEFDSSSVSVYPNPTTGNVKVNLGQEYTAASVKLLNALGQTLMYESYGFVSEFDLDIHGAPGIYLLEIETQQGSCARIRVIKK